MYFIKEIGPNVNLGNVKLEDVLVLEAQRCGLRSETFYMEDHECKLLLIRHLPTEWNKKRKLQGRRDIDISHITEDFQKGIVQNQQYLQ